TPAAPASSSSMRVRFEATLDDVVDVSLRALARSRVARGWRWQGSLAAGVLTGITLFLTLSLLDPLGQEPPELKFILTALGAVSTAVIYPFMYRWIVATRLRNYCKEKLGAAAPFTVEVQLDPEAVRVKQLGTEVAIEWASVEEIQEREDSVDIVTRHSEIIAVRRRAFDSFAAME